MGGGVGEGNVVLEGCDWDRFFRCAGAVWGWRGTAVGAGGTVGGTSGANCVAIAGVGCGGGCGAEGIGEPCNFIPRTVFKPLSILSASWIMLRMLWSSRTYRGFGFLNSSSCALAEAIYTDPLELIAILA